VSATNLDIVRRGLDAYNSDDVDAWIELADPEVELVALGSLLEGGAYRGYDGIRRFFVDMTDEWAERRLEVEALREAGDRVVVLGHFHARGRASGADVRFPAAWNCELRDGRILSIRAYTDQAAALTAAGLSE
jgi:ketosteroid isomerase-like protein